MVTNDNTIVVRHAVITIPMKIDIRIESSSAVVSLLLVTTLPVLMSRPVRTLFTNVYDFSVRSGQPKKSVTIWFCNDYKFY